MEDSSLYLSPRFREDFWTSFTFCFTEEDVENFDVTNLSQDVLRSIEADSFWCMSKLLDGIQVSWLCPCGLPRPRASLQACERLTAPLCQPVPPPSMALPRSGPPILTSLPGLTAFQRQRPGILWSLTKSPCWPALSSECAAPFYHIPRAPWCFVHRAGLCRGCPTPRCSVDPQHPLWKTSLCF